MLMTNENSIANEYDEKNMIITMLVSMILIVWVADKLTFMSLNLVIVWLIVQYIVIATHGIAEHV